MLAPADRVQECHRLLKEYGLTTADLDVDELYLVNNGFYARLWTALETRDKPRDLEKEIDQKIFEEYVSVFKQIPEEAKLMWADDEFAIHFDEADGTVYVTESPSFELPSDEVEEMLRKQIKVIDNMTNVLEEMRAELVRNL